ncbi:MAG: transposase [Chloroflexi bacterium]|nr:transposase [Chloroflexota bacterium]
MDKRYPSDLDDAEWQAVAAVLPLERPTGRPRKHDLRHIINAILYLQRTACPWRMLPRDLPPWQTVYDYYRRWQRDGTWQHVLIELEHSRTR